VFRKKEDCALGITCGKEKGGGGVQLFICAAYLINVERREKVGEIEKATWFKKGQKRELASGESQREKEKGSASFISLKKKRGGKKKSERKKFHTSSLLGGEGPKRRIRGKLTALGKKGRR